MLSSLRYLGHTLTTEGQRLAGGSQQHLEGEADLGTSLGDPRVGGGVCTYLGEVLLGGIPGNDTFGVRDGGGGDPPYGEDTGEFPPLGGMTDHRSTPPATIQWELALPSTDVRNENSGDGGTGDLH